MASRNRVRPSMMCKRCAMGGRAINLEIKGCAGCVSVRNSFDALWSRRLPTDVFSRAIWSFVRPVHAAGLRKRFYLKSIETRKPRLINSFVRFCKRIKICAKNKNKNCAKTTLKNAVFTLRNSKMNVTTDFGRNSRYV